MDQRAIDERAIFDAYIDGEIELIDHCLKVPALSEYRNKYPDRASIKSMRYQEDGREIVKSILTTLHKRHRKYSEGFQDKYIRLRDLRLRTLNICVEKNRNLVLYMVSKWTRSGLNEHLYDDLVQEGSIGLMTAVTRYDPEMGYRFSTYATWWIKQGIRRYSESNRSLIRIPYHLQTELNQVDKENKKSGAITGEDSIDLYSEKMIKNRPQLRYAKHRVFSLDAPVGSDPDMTYLDVFVSESESPDELCLKNEYLDTIKSYYELLDSRELDVIKNRSD